MNKCWLHLVFFISTINVYAQPVLTDSLRHILRNSPNDTNKVRQLGIATAYLDFTQPDSGLYYADSIIRLSEELDYSYGRAIGYFQKAYCYINLGDYSKAMLHANQTVRLQDAAGDLTALSPGFGALTTI